MSKIDAIRDARRLRNDNRIKAETKDENLKAKKLKDLRRIRWKDAIRDTGK